MRLAGCNLRCTWCDSEYTFKGGQRMTLEEIEAEVHRLSPDGGLVEITGGEPLLQEREVVAADGAAARLGLHRACWRPAASVRWSGCPRHVVKIVDVKCPDSGEGDTFRIENLNALSRRDEVKFVIASRRDYEFARDFIRRACARCASRHR